MTQGTITCSVTLVLAWICFVFNGARTTTLHMEEGITLGIRDASGSTAVVKISINYLLDSSRPRVFLILDVRSNEAPLDSLTWWILITWYRIPETVPPFPLCVFV